MGSVYDTEREQIAALREGHRRLARAQYAEVEALTGWFRRGAAAEYVRSGRLLHSPDEGMAAAMEAAAVLRMTEATVDRSIDVGLALEGLPCTRAGFAAGDLDQDRVRVIVEVTACVNPAVRVELDRRLAERGLSCDPVALRRVGRRWAITLDPDSASERRRRAVEDRDVRVRAVQDGMAHLDGWLPVEAAQRVATRLMRMAQQQVCAGDPRTIPQRRADALVALVDGSGRLVCGCGRGVDCPRTGTADPTPAPVSAGAVIQVGVSLETLLGLQDWPGYLQGAGAIDPDLARTLAKDGRWEWILAAIDTAADYITTGTHAAETTANPAAVAGDRGSVDTVTGTATNPPDNDETTSDSRVTTGTTTDHTDTDPTAIPDGAAAAVVTPDTPTNSSTGVPAYSSSGTDLPGNGKTDATADTATETTYAPANDLPPVSAEAETTGVPASDTAVAEAETGTDAAATGTTAGDPTIAVSEATADTEAGTSAEAVTHDHASETNTTNPNDKTATASPAPTRTGTAARRTVTAACHNSGFDHPDHPAALRYPWPPALAAWIRARDGSCRWPGCTTPAHRCDIDHTIRFDHTNPKSGGRTVRSNGACLCRRHHAAKTAGENGLNGWRVRQSDAGRLHWTTPTGEIIITDPDGAPDLWPTPDIRLPTTEPEPHTPNPAPTEYAGYPITSDTELTTILTAYHSTIEEWLDYLLDTHPKPEVARTVTEFGRATPEPADDEPPPF